MSRHDESRTDPWQGSSLGGEGMDDLCSRTSSETVDSILRKASSVPFQEAVAQIDTRPAPRFIDFSLLSPAEIRARLTIWWYERPADRNLVFCATGLGLVFLLLPRIAEGKLVLAATDLLPAGAALFAAAECARAAVSRPPDLGPHQYRDSRRAWILLAGAALAWFLGEVVWTGYELSGRLIPLPSLSDLGFLATLPLTVAALLMFPATGRNPMIRVRLFLDALTIALSLAGIAWLFTIHSWLVSDNTETLRKIITTIYPIGDIACLAIAASAFLHSRRADLVPLGLITSGLVFLTAADLGFLYFTQHTSYASGDVVDLGWVIGFFLFGMAARHRSPIPEVPRTSPRGRLARVALPQITFSLLMTAIAYYAVTRGGHVSKLVILDALALGLLNVVRHLTFAVRSDQLGAQVASDTGHLRLAVAAVQKDTDDAISLIDPSTYPLDAEFAMNKVVEGMNQVERRFRDLSDSTQELRLRL